MFKLLSLITLLLTTLDVAQAQTPCFFFLLDHVDYPTSLGLALDLESSACQLHSLILVMQAGDGTGRIYAKAASNWQFEHEYTVTLRVLNGSQQILLDGQLVASSTAGFAPTQGPLRADEIPFWGSGQADYRIEQTSLEITNGMQSILLPNPAYKAPLPRDLLLGGPPFWVAPFAEDPAQTTNVTVRFIIHAPAAPLPFTGLIDGFGQAASGAWPSKVSSDSDLKAAIATERNWLDANPAPAGLDQYGGSTIAGWRDRATGYFHTAFHNNRWWLISPLGNPTFYIALNSVPSQENPAATGTPTRIAGRLSEFADLPPTAGDFAAAYTTSPYSGTADAGGPVTFWFGISNLIRKYGPQWQTTYSNIVQQRLGSWAFTGLGKWSTPDSSLTLPYVPVMAHDTELDLIPNGHPDIFDPQIVTRLKSYFTNLIHDDITNPRILGWSVGNELGENIAPSEITAVLALPASVPAKQALMNQALTTIYGGDLSGMAAAWGIAAGTVADVYAATPELPAEDIETLREFYEQAYYKTLYQMIKGIDPNHLYLGSWVSPPQDWVNAADWRLMAPNCDVLGFDYYSPRFHTDQMDALLNEANRPVIIGEFSFPPNYDGERGFGSYSVPSESESDAGSDYAQYLADASASPFVVGVGWYQYQDDPASGRGHPAAGTFPGPVYGDDFAFGMIDITDQPKYDLLNKVRSANLNALHCLGLLGATPLLTQASVVNAAGTTGGAIAAGEIVTIYGCNGGTAALQTGELNASGILKTQAGDTRVLFDGVAAPLIYTTAGQSAAVVPFHVEGQPSTSVQIEYEGVASPPLTLQVSGASPGIFTVNQSGQGQAAVVNQDGTLNSPLNPAPAGSICALYATGLGQTAPALADGQIANFPGGQYPQLPRPVTVAVGGTEATVQYAGVAPASVAGLFQVNFQVPPNLPSGSQFVVLTAAGVSSAPVIVSLR